MAMAHPETKEVKNTDPPNEGATNNGATNDGAINEGSTNNDTTNNEDATKNDATETDEYAANNDATNEHAANNDATSNEDATNQDSTNEKGTNNATNDDTTNNDVTFTSNEDATKEEVTNNDAANEDTANNDATNEDTTNNDATNEYTANNDATNEYTANNDATNEYTANNDVTTNEDATNNDATNEYTAINDATTNEDATNNDATNEDVRNSNDIEVKVILKKEIKGNVCGWEDCTETSYMKCGACQKVPYCCSDHQKKHWKAHRKDCCPYMIKQNEEFGSYLVAARDLKANVEIIRESPAVYAPVYREISNDCPNGDPAPDISFCLTCCNHISERKVCSKCNWPICGIACENNICHSEYECEYISKSKISYDETVADKCAFDVYKSVFVLRCLIFRVKNPTVWKNVEKSFIAKEEELDTTDSKETYNDLDVFMQLITCFGAANLVQDSNDLNCILNVICYLSVGDTRTVPHENGSYVRSAIFIYEKLLMLGSNNCHPNSSWGISFPPTFEIVIRSAVPIKKGEMISIPLNNEYDLYPTYLRQVHRFKGRRKLCKCARCSDPTELQTNLSSVKCFQCKKGYFTPIRPLLIKSDWRCCYCDVIVECTKIFDIVKTAEASIHQALDDINIEELENIFNRLIKSTFHPNHFMIINLSYHILQMHMQNIFNLNEFGLERVVAHCRNILAVADIILPGLSMIRATILTFQTKAMCLQMRDFTADSKQLSAPKRLANRLEKLGQYLSDALEYYKTDPNTTLPTGENGFVEELETIQSQLFRATNELVARNENKKLIFNSRK